MRKGYKKNPKRSGIQAKTLLIVCSVLCAASVIFSFVSKNDTGPLSKAAGIVLAPMQKGVSRVSTGVVDFFDIFRSKTEMQKENEALKKRIDELNLENNKMQSDRDELKRLREQFKLNEPYTKYDMVGARLIAKDPGNWFNIITVNKGSNDGIEPNMNVISDGALVGIVVSVNPNSSTVRTIIDDLSAVSCVVQGKDNLLILEGNLKTMRDGYITAKDIHLNADVKVGDKIVTSPVSEKFLPDILIGYITEVQEDEALLTRQVKVAPIVDFNNLREVMILTKLKDKGDGDGK